MKHLLAALAALLIGSWLPGVAQAQGGINFTGTVAEVKDVEAYSYLRLKAADGEIWAAVNKAPVKTGSVVTVTNAMVMNNFESRSLKRSFDRILFGSLGKTPDGAKPSTIASLGAATTAPAMPPAAGKPGAAAGMPGAATAMPGAAAGMPSPHGAGAAKPAEPVDVKVPKASGANARTVAEVVGKRTELKGKQAVVRGKVVKYNGGIMGSNWVHLRDGSGSAKDENNDLLVRTKDVAKVGDVVVATGVVKADVDLGSGYAYSVLLDEAKLGK